MDVLYFFPKTCLAHIHDPRIVVEDMVNHSQFDTLQAKRKRELLNKIIARSI